MVRDIFPHLEQHPPLPLDDAPPGWVFFGPLTHVVVEGPKMSGLPVPNMRVAGRVFPGWVHRAVGKQSDSLVVPGVYKMAHSIAHRANQVPEILGNQNGIQP